MAVAIELSTGEKIIVKGVELSSVKQAFDKALAGDHTLEIRSAKGKALVLNPHRIVSLEPAQEPAHELSHGAHQESAREPLREENGSSQNGGAPMKAPVPLPLR